MINVTGDVVSIIYNTAKRPERVKLEGITMTDLTFDTVGRVHTSTDNSGYMVTSLYNGNNKLEQKTYPDASTEEMTYHALGGVLTSTNRSGAVSTYTYDDHGNRLTRTIPGMPVLTLTYDDWDCIDTMIDGIGTTDYDFDDLGRPKQVDGPWANDTIVYTYEDALRKITRAINGTAETFISDNLGRRNSMQNPLGLTSYNYVGNTNRVDNINRPNGLTTDFDYHTVQDDILLKTINNKASGGAIISKFDYTYNDLNQVASWTRTLGAGATPSVLGLVYNARNQLQSAKLAESGSQTDAWHFTYDKAGNRQSKQRGLNVLSGQFNGLNQMASFNAGGPTYFGGQLDEPADVTINGQTAKVAADNSFEAYVDLPAGASTVTIEATDPSDNTATQQYQVTNSTTSSRILTHDTRGNVLTDGLRTYEWDDLNQLTAIIQGTHRSEFIYNGAGERVEIIEKENGVMVSHQRYLWCGDIQPCEERDAATNTTTVRYYDNGEVRIGGTDAGNYFYTRDHLGSLRELVDSSGIIRARYDYTPYGERTKLSGDLECLWGFTGHFTHTQSDLVLALYRAYDPELGRWLSPDPIKEDGGLNLYVYVGNDPVNFWDPSGLMDNDAWSEYLSTRNMSPKAKDAYVKGKYSLDGLQNSLSMAGMLPGVGIIPDALNTGVSVLRGNGCDALTNAAAMIPVGGQLATANKVKKALTATSKLAKGAQKKLSKSRAKKLEKLMEKDGTNIHDFKGKGGGKKDFFTDKKTGDIYLKPKDGSGPGEFSGYNVSEFD